MKEEKVTYNTAKDERVNAIIMQSYEESIASGACDNEATSYAAKIAGVSENRVACIVDMVYSR